MGGDAGEERRVLDEALVFLGGDEGVGGLGVRAKELLGGQGMDLACQALVADGAGGGFLGGWRGGSLGSKLLAIFGRRFLRNSTYHDGRGWCAC